MKLLIVYARLVIFSAGILMGVQIPNFVDQYGKRISAHYTEARMNFSGYQQTADKHFSGNVEALLEHYGASSDTVFKSDAENIRQIYRRQQAFAGELNELKTSLFKKIFHVAFYADRAVLQETMAEFSYTVPLNHEAIICGLILGLLLSLLLDLIVGGIGGLYAALAGAGNRPALRRH